jgi:hypothetical protein
LAVNSSKLQKTGQCKFDEDKKAQRILKQKETPGNQPLRRSRRRWYNNNNKKHAVEM